jgi:glycosyltransferase involved in cell wall biosynthesis
MAILEALASRVPVVISEACHFPEVAEVGAGEIVTLSPQEIARALLRLTCDPQLRERMATAGRRLVENRFTWQRAAGAAIAVYERASAQ